MKHFNINTNVDNNINDDDETYDDKTRDKINYIRIIFSWLGNIITINNRALWNRRK